MGAICCCKVGGCKSLDNRSSTSHGDRREEELSEEEVEDDEEEYPGDPDETEGVMRFVALTDKQLRDFEGVGVQPAQLWSMEQSERKTYTDKCRSFTTKLRPPVPIAPHSQELRLVLLGKTASGKSSTGNLILGRTVFGKSASNVTNEMHRGTVEGLRVRVIDTPDFSDTNKKPAEVLLDIVKVMERFTEGVHGFLFIHNVSTHRFTQDQQKIFTMFKQDIFGPNFLSRCFMVLTHADGMERSLKDFIKTESGTILGNIMRKDLRNRVIAVENSHPSQYFRGAMQNQVVRLVASSPGEVYTNHLLQQQREIVRQSVEPPAQQFVPMMETEFSKALYKMTFSEIKNMGRQERRGSVRKVVSKVMKHIGSVRITEAALTKVAKRVLDRKRDRITNLRYYLRR